MQSGGSYQSHGLDIKDRVLDYPSNADANKHRIALEFKELLENGHQKIMEQLREENDMLKQNLITFQQHLGETIDQALWPMQELLTSKVLITQFNELVGKYRITSAVSQLQFSLPMSIASSHYVINMFQTNLEKFRSFSKQVLNPAIIAELVVKHKALDAGKLKLINVESPVLLPPQTNKRGRWERHISKSPQKKNPFNQLNEDDTDSDKIDYNKI